MMLQRKIRMNTQGFRRAFKDMDARGTGWLTVQDFRYALHRMDINLGEEQASGRPPTPASDPVIPHCGPHCETTLPAF